MINTDDTITDLYHWAWDKTAIVYGYPETNKTTFALMVAADWALHGKNVYFFAEGDVRRLRGKLFQDFPWMTSPAAGDVILHMFSETSTLEKHVQQLTRLHPLPDLVIFDAKKAWGDMIKGKHRWPPPRIGAPVLITHRTSEKAPNQKSGYLQYGISALFRVSNNKGFLERHITYTRGGGSVYLHQWT